MKFFLQEFVIFSVIALFVLPSEAFFETCDKKITLTKLNHKQAITIDTEEFRGGRYPSGSSCRYRIEAPAGYQINAQCYLKLDHNPELTCSTERFFIVESKQETLKPSNGFCTDDYVSRVSDYNNLVIAYTSDSGSKKSGSFSCTLRITKAECDCGWSGKKEGRIYGGIFAYQNEFPSAVALKDRSSRITICGAVAIGNKHLLTTATCASKFACAGQIEAQFGKHNDNEADDTTLVKRRISHIKIHEGYNEKTRSNDIAILCLSEPISYSKVIGPVCLPLLYSEYDFSNNYLTLAGWGLRQWTPPPAATLEKVQLPVITNDKCRPTEEAVNKDKLCAFETIKGPCLEDEGGPAYWVNPETKTQILAGLIHVQKKCPSGSHYVFTRVSSYLKWIQKQTEIECCAKL